MTKVTLSITVRYNSDHTNPRDLGRELDALIERGLAKPGLASLLGAPVFGEFYEPSDEDEVEVLEALGNAIDVTREELGKLKEVLETNS